MPARKAAVPDVNTVCHVRSAWTFQQTSNTGMMTVCILTEPARDITKEYLAVCYGVTEKEGEMTDFLFHDRIKNKSTEDKNEEVYFFRRL